MSLLDDFVLRVKRADTPATRFIHDTYRRCIRFNVPDTAALRRLYAALYLSHDVWVSFEEWALAKLLYEPMVRARFAHVGARLQVNALPYITGHARITVGDDCRFSKFAVSSGRFCDRPELIIGDRCSIGSDVFFSVNKRIRLGNHVGIAGRVAISDSDGHPSDPERRARGEQMTAEDILPVTIEDNVWIGRDAHILKGVTIGRDSVVASGSVVASDVPPGALAMGVPARVVKRS